MVNLLLLNLELFLLRCFLKNLDLNKNSRVCSFPNDDDLDGNRRFNHIESKQK
jgi:hypothetical protein